MLLIIDLGNTNLTIGLYDGVNLNAHWRLSTDHQRMPDEYGLQLHSLLQNAGHQLVLFNVRIVTKCIFTVAGLRKIFIFSNNEETALAALQSTKSSSELD